MKKPVEMSLETARQMYKENNEITNKWLLENFTKEELEPKKGFTWEESLSKEGYYINSSCNIEETKIVSKAPNLRDVFLTEKHAKSALAFAQLSHIVERYNQGKNEGEVFFMVEGYKNGKLAVNHWYNVNCHFKFYTIEDAETSMEVNRQLWLDYWMID